MPVLHDDNVTYRGRGCEGRHMSAIVAETRCGHAVFSPPSPPRTHSQLKLSEMVVVLRHRPFALVDLDQYRRLVVGGGREDL